MQLCNQKMFRIGKGFVELGYFDKHFVRNHKKKRPHKETFWRFFLLDTITFSMENLTPRWTQSRPLFKNQGTFLRFSKKIRGGLPYSSVVARLWVWLNIHQYPWISQKILKNTWINCSDYTCTLNMPDHVTCLTCF